MHLSNCPATVTVVQYDKNDGRHRQEEKFHIYTAMTVLYAFVVGAPMESTYKSFDSYSDARILNRLTCLHVNIRIHMHLSAKGKFQETHRLRGVKAFPHRRLRPKTARLRPSRIL